MARLKANHTSKTSAQWWPWTSFALITRLRPAIIFFRYVWHGGYTRACALMLIYVYLKRYLSGGKIARTTGVLREIKVVRIVMDMSGLVMVVQSSIIL